MSNPLEHPSAFDRIALDDDEIGLYCERVGGGDRERKIEQQQSPGYGGYFTVRRGEVPSEITYRFHMWEPPHFDLWQSLVGSLRAADKKPQPKVYKLTDLAVHHNEIKQVTLQKISALIKVSQGHYAGEVTFAEYRKKRPMGGVAIPTADKSDQETQVLEDQAKALDAELKNEQAALARGEGHFTQAVRSVLGL